MGKLYIGINFDKSFSSTSTVNYYDFFLAIPVNQVKFG